MSYEFVISPGAIATAFNKDPQLIEFVLHKSFNGARFRIEGAQRSQLVFDVDDVIRWASTNLPGSLNPRSIAALRQLAFPVPTKGGRA